MFLNKLGANSGVSYIVAFFISSGDWYIELNIRKGRYLRNWRRRTVKLDGDMAMLGAEAE